jgi:hypothetical protein
MYLRRFSRGVNLSQDLIVGKVLKLNCRRGALGATQTISLAENRIHNGLLAPPGFAKLNGTIGAGRDTLPTPDACLLNHLANRAGGDDGIMREKRQNPAGSSIRLLNRFPDQLGIMSGSTKINTIGGELNRF